jgi:hypothetical protein
MFGIKHQSLNVYDTGDAKLKLHHLDVVIDCTYPSGQLYEIPVQIKEQISAVVAAMKPGSAFIYMSSIMAYGTGPDEKYVRHHRIAKSSYAYIKRVAEKVTFRVCKRHKVNAYVFRLGQVHGFLQSVNVAYRQELRSPITVYVDGSAEDNTNTIFISSIAEAILECGNKSAKPGLYTLVSSPQWKLKQLYDYYLHSYKGLASVIYKPSAPVKGRFGGIRKLLINVAKRQRNFLETYILINRPNLSIKLKGIYRINETKAATNKPIRYTDFNLLGKPPHKCVSNIKCDYNEIAAIESSVENYYYSVLDAQRTNF